MPLSVLQQEFCFQIPTQSRFLSRDVLPHKNGTSLAEWLSGGVESSFYYGHILRWRRSPEICILGIKDRNLTDIWITEGRSAASTLCYKIPHAENPKSHPGPSQRTWLPRHKVNWDFTQERCTFYIQTITTASDGYFPPIFPDSSAHSCSWTRIAKESYVTIFILLHFVSTLLNKDHLQRFIVQLKYNC